MFKSLNLQQVQTIRAFTRTARLYCEYLWCTGNPGIRAGWLLYFRFPFGNGLGMNIRFFASTLIVLLGFGSVVAAEKPNILFVFADDQCFETIRAFGHTDIDTPNLDKLVERGMTFSRAYNMGSWSGAVCVASRHMLNTGAFVWNAQVISEQLNQNPNKKQKEGEKAKDSKWPDFQKEGLMWSQLMGKAGYDTYFTGKWHVRADATKIFKVARNVRGGMPKDTKEGYNRPIDGQPDPWSPYDP